MLLRLESKSWWFEFGMFLVFFSKGEHFSGSIICQSSGG